MYSTDILEEYYETKLCGDVAGGGAHKEMLIYIRSNVRTSFDKAFEDAIGYLFVKESNGADDGTGTSNDQKWHSLIQHGGLPTDNGDPFDYDESKMSVAYNEYIKSKAERLATLEASYVGLPS